MPVGMSVYSRRSRGALAFPALRGSPWAPRACAPARAARPSCSRPAGGGRRGRREEGKAGRTGSRWRFPTGISTAGRRLEAPRLQRPATRAVPTIAATSGSGLSMHVSASVFKAYDIRGIVGKTHRRALRRAARPRLRQRGAAPPARRAVAVGRDGRALRAGARRPRCARPRRRPASTSSTSAPVTTPMLYYVAATRAAHGCTQRHPGDRQPQPEGLQRLQDGARRPRHLRRGDPAPAPAHGGRRLRARAAAAPRRWTSSPSTARASSATASWRGR